MKQENETETLLEARVEAQSDGTTEEKCPKIYQAMVDALRATKEVKKGTCVLFPNGTRRIDDVMNAMHPILAEYGIFAMPIVHEMEFSEGVTSKGVRSWNARLKVEYRFYASDGSSVSAIVAGEGFDTSDKATNKAMSYCYKYALLQAFCIPTEEFLEGDDSKIEEQKVCLDGATKSYYLKRIPQLNATELMSEGKALKIYDDENIRSAVKRRYDELNPNTQNNGKEGLDAKAL